jgi:hypothetical protein
MFHSTALIFLLMCYYWKPNLTQRQVLVAFNKSGNINNFDEYETSLQKSQNSSFTFSAEDLSHPNGFAIILKVLLVNNGLKFTSVF